MKKVVIVNMNSQRKIVVDSSSVLSLRAPKNPCTDISVTVIGEICKELGCTTWWNDLIKTVRNDKKRVTILMKKVMKEICPEWTPTDVWVRDSTTIKWRGTEREEGKVQVHFKVPSEHVQKLLRHSGIHGYLVDYVIKDKEEQKRHADTFARIKIPG